MRLLLLLVFSTAALAQDPAITPGVVRRDLSSAEICATKWGSDARHVTPAMKRAVFESYGISCVPLTASHGPACGEWEVDHLVSRELGGADDVANLWPQPYTGPWNARMKDRLENHLHREVCAGNLSLRAAQALVRSDWRGAYKRYFGR